jgi:hypothetical protein
MVKMDDIKNKKNTQKNEIEEEENIEGNTNHIVQFGNLLIR